MSRLRGDVRPIFPAAAIARYKNAAHEEISLKGLEFIASSAGGTESTRKELNILKESRFRSLADFLYDCVADYLDNVYCYKYEQFEIVHAWINRSRVGCFQNMHYHGNSIVSGVYYLSADPSLSSPLCFDKPELNTMPYMAIATREQTIFTANRVAYPVATGQAYLFPSQLRHGYEAPTKDAARISLAFNVMLCGIGLFYRL